MSTQHLQLSTAGNEEFQVPSHRRRCPSVPNAAVQITTGSEGKKTNFYTLVVDSGLTVIRLSTVIWMLFCICYVKYPKLLAALKSFSSARFGSWACPDLCLWTDRDHGLISTHASPPSAIDNVFNSRTADGAISSSCHESVYKRKPSQSFPFCRQPLPNAPNLSRVWK